MKPIVLLLFLILPAESGQKIPPLDLLGITVRNESREVAYTNKVSAFYYTESSGEHRVSWQGLNVAGEEILEDYSIIVNGSALVRSRAEEVRVYPDRLERRYGGGVTERVFLADSLAALSVEVEASHPVEVTVIVWFAGGRRAKDLSLALRDSTALVAISGLSDRRDGPLTLAITGPGFLPVARDSALGNRVSPLILVSGRGRKHHLVFVAESDPARGVTIAREFDPVFHLAKRRARMERLLRSSEVQTADADFSKSLAWAKLSLDALIMHQRGTGIFAGLPWFNNYWGRDTFIALPGATLVSGEFQEAAAILRSFAAHQQTEQSSPDYGRIPNFVSLNDVAYNTADGTPRFVMMAREYVERSGDRRFAAEIYPTILRSIEGTLRHHCDSLGFLTHGDAETWMDAVGPSGPWSPRGNRANDIQALWDKQLGAGIWFAALAGDVSSARAWDMIRQRLRTSFSEKFLRDDSLADHLRVDGTPVFALRPNQIFTGDLLDESLRASIVGTVVSKLTYPYGVASLSQDDDGFHPYHQNEPYYPKDAAYHNGTVWTWLQGPVISELCRAGRQDVAFQVTRNTVHQILDRGAVGTQSELLDALPRPAAREPEPSGTFSQAWNLAEFIRNFYDDYLGLRISLFSRKVTLRPRIPKGLAPLTARIPCGTGALVLNIADSPEGCSLEIRSEGSPDTLSFELTLRAAEGYELRGSWRMAPQSETAIECRRGRFLGNPLPPDFQSALIQGTNTPLPATISLAEPRLRMNLPALRGVDHPLLSHAMVISKNPSALQICRAVDPAGDDTGTVAGRLYRYPQNRAFVPGGFDLRTFEVSVDSANAYFRIQLTALSDPGWHPEYGFQLTFLALAIDRDGADGTGERRIGQNSEFSLPGDRGYERLILVGGGIRVLDSAGTVITGYVPLSADARHPFGNAAGGRIEFAVPLRYIGMPTPGWRFTLLAGAQDDHGGAGLGEFRTVNSEAGEWNGGGRKRPGESNVYDMLEAAAHN